MLPSQVEGVARSAPEPPKPLVFTLAAGLLAEGLGEGTVPGHSPGVGAEQWATGAHRKCGSWAHVLGGWAVRWVPLGWGGSAQLCLWPLPSNVLEDRAATLKAGRTPKAQLLLREGMPSARPCPLWDLCMDMVCPPRTHASDRLVFFLAHRPSVAGGSPASQT